MEGKVTRFSMLFPLQMDSGLLPFQNGNHLSPAIIVARVGLGSGSVIKETDRYLEPPPGIESTRVGVLHGASQGSRKRGARQCPENWPCLALFPPVDPAVRKGTF